jgi:serine phosphatase RsbU (regulator of sigma subunit)
MRDTQDQFVGVATIDLKLEGLHAFMENMRQRTGGYIFLLDRNNKFLTFPKEEDVEVIGKDEKGNKTRDFLTIADMAKKQPLFAPIADAVHAMNKDITERAKSTKGFRADIASKIDHDSDQIDAEEAEFIAAAIADPLAEQTKDTSLYRKFEIEKDYITGESAIVFLFHVPQSYWKVIIVKPLREAGAVASQITSVLITMITVTVLVGVALAALLLHRFFTIPLRNTTEAVTNIGHVVSEKQFQELEAHKIKSVREDELGQLSGVVNSLASELQSSYGSLLELNQNLEQKVEDRTRRLQQTLEEVSDLKKRQDGDYFLTSLLIKPLAVNRVEGNHTDVRFFMKQKKSFIFKNREDELGGDICLADTIHLHGRTFTVFLNGDAMGKSIQGAGGALVLGAVARMMIERTKLTMSMQNLYPERWLKNAFIEFQKMFESFDGSMLVSVVLGLIDDDSGVLYVINAEHPRTVLYRNGKAAFLEEDTIHRKLGIGGLDGKLQIGTYQLETGDVIIAGSDGRDDILIGMGQDGTRTMNSDETLFVKHVEAGNGNLDQIYAGLVESGEITDDLSLLRVEYRKEASPERKASQEAISRARALAKGGDQTGGVRELEGALGRDPLNPELVRPLIKYYLEKKNFARTAEIAEPLAEAGHLDNEFAFVTAHCRKKLNRLKEAADMAERVYLREPELAKNLFLLAEVYARMGNIARGADFLDKAEKLDPGNPAVAKVRAMFGTQN